MRFTTLVNHETGYISVIGVTDDNQLIELDLPLETMVEIQAAIEKGRMELEN